MRKGITDCTWSINCSRANSRCNSRGTTRAFGGLPSLISSSAFSNCQVGRSVPCALVPPLGTYVFHIQIFWGDIIEPFSELRGHIHGLQQAIEVACCSPVKVATMRTRRNSYLGQTLTGSTGPQTLRSPGAREDERYPAVNKGVENE